MQGYRVYDPSGVSVSIGANGGGAGARTGLYCVGNTNPSGRGMNGKVYDTRGLAPTLTTNRGQGGKVFVDQTLNHPETTKIARCLVACYTGRLINWRATNSGVLETGDAVLEEENEETLGARAVLTPDRLEKRQNGRRMKDAGEPMFTLTAQDRHGVYLDEEEQPQEIPEETGTVEKYGKIRRLTPRECFRLQGFPDELYEKAAAVNSETQLYKQAGNAVTATVAYAVAMSLPESREDWNGETALEEVKEEISEEDFLK